VIFASGGQASVSRHKAVILHYSSRHPIAGLESLFWHPDLHTKVSIDTFVQ
jgi:hypothetical protein